MALHGNDGWLTVVDKELKQAVQVSSVEPVTYPSQGQGAWPMQYPCLSETLEANTSKIVDPTLI